MPVLISQGEIDTLVRPDITQDYVDGQCKAGAEIELDTYPGIGHFDIRPVVPPHIVSWFSWTASWASRSRPGCSTKSRSPSGCTVEPTCRGPGVEGAEEVVHERVAVGFPVVASLTGFTLKRCSIVARIEVVSYWV